MRGARRAIGHVDRADSGALRLVNDGLFKNPRFADQHQQRSIAGFWIQGSGHHVLECRPRPLVDRCEGDVQCEGWEVYMQGEYLPEMVEATGEEILAVMQDQYRQA